MYTYNLDNILHQLCFNFLKSYRETTFISSDLVLLLPICTGVDDIGVGYRGELPARLRDIVEYVAEGCFGVALPIDSDDATDRAMWFESN